MINELDSRQEARLFVTTLDEWTFEPQVITYGGILICRKGKTESKLQGMGNARRSCDNDFPK